MSVMAARGAKEERAKLSTLADNFVDHDEEAGRRALALLPDLDPRIGRG